MVAKARNVLGVRDRNDGEVEKVPVVLEITVLVFGEWQERDELEHHLNGEHVGKDALQGGGGQGSRSEGEWVKGVGQLRYYPKTQTNARTHKNTDARTHARTHAPISFPAGGSAWTSHPQYLRAPTDLPWP